MRIFPMASAARSSAAVLRTLAFAAVALLAVPPALGTESLHGQRIAEMDPVVSRQLRELDPANISARDVAQVLARVTAPRIILLQGSFGPVTMEPFADFLIAMGYPADRIGNPRDGRRSASSFMDSRQLAGMLAWYYEAEGVRPVLIGHSQGGMLTIRVLHELAGAFSDAIPVWNPLTDAAEARTSFVDPRTGELRPVVGLQVPYAAAIATGMLPRLLLGQWSMLPKLRKIPDSVIEFSGFSMEWDLIAGHFPGSEPFAATGTAIVRNVRLPASYTHIGLPHAAHLATNAVTRAWIDRYAPGTTVAVPDEEGVDTTNLIHAADIWYSVKKNWCESARRRLDAKRELP